MEEFIFKKSATYILQMVSIVHLEESLHWKSRHFQNSTNMVIGQTVAIAQSHCHTFNLYVGNFEIENVWHIPNGRPGRLTLAKLSVENMAADERKGMQS